MIRKIGVNDPIQVTDLGAALRLIKRGLNPTRNLVTHEAPLGPSSASKACAKPRVNQNALNSLAEICARTGELFDLDVQVAARQLGHRSAKSLLKAYDAVKELKVSGLLENAAAASELSAPLVAKLSDKHLPSRVREHIYMLAAQELLENVTDPHKDDLLRALLVHEFGGRDDAPPPDMTLRDRNARQTLALTALLDDKKLSEPLTLAILGQLGKHGDRSAVPALEKVAKLGGTESIRATASAAIHAIEKSQKMTIVLASFEVKPYAGSGGLGNVMRELPKALAKMGHRVVVVTPLHRMTDRSQLEETGLEGRVKGGRHDDRSFKILKDVADGVEHYFIDNQTYFGGRHGIYLDEKDKAYRDNDKRYDFFSATIPHAIKSILGDEKPDIVQLNDAHTGPAAAYLKADSYFEKSKTIMAIHNLNFFYQGVSPAKRLHNYGFADMNVFKRPLGDKDDAGAHNDFPANYWGRVNFLKLGLMKADAAITVSRQYMKEILLDDENGQGLQATLQAMDARGSLWGNLNGIDTKVWNSETDPALPVNFSFLDQSGKATCKAELQKEFKLPVKPDVPVIGVVARLAAQKGWNDTLANIRHTLESGRDVQYVIQGEGDRKIEADIRALMKEFPGQIGFEWFVQDQAHADKEHRIYGGSDFFLMPSLFEPCGLPQMYALRYLTVPIVRAVGGLEESIQSWNHETGKGNGFKFSGGDINNAVDAALDWYAAGVKDPEKRQPLLRNCALSDFSWETSSAVEQAAFYRDVLNA